MLKQSKFMGSKRIMFWGTPGEKLSMQSTSTAKKDVAKIENKLIVAERQLNDEMAKTCPDMARVERLNTIIANMRQTIRNAQR